MVGSLTMVIVPVPDLRGRLAARMRQQGMSQKALAQRSGVSAATLSRILSGETLNPTQVQISRLALALDVPTDYLIGQDCPPSEADLPPDIRARIAAMPLEYREIIGELVAQGNRLPDTPEGKAAFREAIRVAVGYLQSVIDQGGKS